MRPAGKDKMAGRERAWRGGLARLLIGCAWVAICFSATLVAQPAETTLTERQVKALCIMNFARYTQWPQWTFADTNAAISIGIVGQDALREDLRRAVARKTINGRPVIVRSLEPGGESDDCQILFISASESKHIPDIIERVRNKPVLTIGETDSFLKEGGAINFALRNGKVRFDVNLDAVRSGGLQLSSKVLVLADEVLGNR